MTLFSRRSRRLVASPTYCSDRSTQTHTLPLSHCFPFYARDHIYCWQRACIPPFFVSPHPWVSRVSISRGKGGEIDLLFVRTAYPMGPACMRAYLINLSNGLAAEGRKRPNSMLGKLRDWQKVARYWHFFSADHSRTSGKKELRWSILSSMRGIPP